ncbi:MAG TPA: sulfatase-like hydrolase/transferase [Kofleriaceae bacterium]|nr:sulfatase-like hydrolase/transferase [Kofleriaceae bacterium]
MQPPRGGISLRALWLAAAVVAVSDGLTTAWAWATWTERPVVALALFAVLLASACLLGLWVAAVARLDHSPAIALVAPLPFTVPLAFAFARSHTARAALGWAALPAALVALTTLALVHKILIPRRFLSCVAGIVALAGAALFSRGTLQPIGALLLAFGFCALAIGFHRPGEPPVRARRAAAWGVTSAVAAFVLLRFSANVRFVTHAQAPATGAVLRTLAALAPVRSPMVHTASAAAAPTATDEGGARFGAANLLIITVDALRPDEPLPEIDRRLPEAIRFTRAYAQAPHTAYSIASLLTASSPDRLTAKPAPPTLGAILRARRWFTEAWYPAGLFFDGRGTLAPYAASRFGFDWADTRTLDARALTDAILERLARLRGREPRALLWAHYFDPHEPYAPVPGRPDAPPRERYAAEVATVDREVARLLDTVATLTRPTVVILTADHGEEFGEHGGAYHGTSLYDEQVHVPLRIAVVGGSPRLAGGGAPRLNGPREVSTPVELVDLVPTALQLLDEPRGPFGGVSLLAAQSGRAGAQVQTRRMLVSGGWKLIHDEHYDLNELYDLATDPAEQHNRFDARPDVAQPLLASLRQRFGLAAPQALLRTLADGGGTSAVRAAAARTLGELGACAEAGGCRAASPTIAGLWAAARDGEATVAAEAAIALGELGDPRAGTQLVALLDRPTTRRRAALALGRLRDARAVPALAEATADIQLPLRRHALHYLGLLGGAEAAPIVMARARDDLAVRTDAYLALGRIAARTGDPAAAAFLADRLADEPYEDARANLAWAVGLSGPRADARALPRLVRLAAAEPPGRWATEALVRLGALTTHAAGGVDFAPGLVAEGISGCRAAPREDRFDAATTCALAAPVARLTLPSPVARGVLVFRARALGDPVSGSLVLNGVTVGTFTLGPGFSERRFAPPAGLLRRGANTVILSATVGAAGAELDHLLVIPTP